ncbi:MAG: ATP-dependent helicase, partial [Lachnospiraceae bacterium]|nr:ATP-dependent helicase [Lachnospiraceae bacterium]
MNNAAQEEAIRTINGPLLLVSCPGSGKTTTLIRRIHAMLESGIAPSCILMVTFTNAAARDMQNKYQSLYGSNPGITFQTIHSLCFNLLRAERKCGNGDLLTAKESRLFFVDRLKQYSWVGDPWELSRAVMTEIGVLRSHEIPISGYVPVSCSNPAFRDLYTAYAEYKEACGKLDFDDLLFACRSMLEYNPRILSKWRGIFRYIQCDEYQDTNPVQRDILYLLAGEHGNLCVVGDDDQSIYRFRGADPSVMRAFPQDYPDARVVTMDTNYRSLAPIAETAGRLIAHNTDRFPKQLKTVRTPEQNEAAVRCVNSSGRLEEMKELVTSIQEKHNEGIHYSDMAVLFRTNDQVRLPAMELSAAEIPFYSTEKISSMYDGWIFGDLRAYAMLALTGGTEEDLLRVLNHPQRYLSPEQFRGAGFSARGLLRAAEYLKKDAYWKYQAANDRIGDWMDALGPGALKWSDPPGKLFDGLIGWRSIHYDEYLFDYAKYRNTDPKEFHEEIEELRGESLRFSTIREWFDYAEDYGRKLSETRKKQDHTGVTLATMHAAKGLEWKAVYLIDVNRGLIPYEKEE